VDARRDAKDGRVRRLRLTEKGRRAFEPLERKSGEEVRRLLDDLPSGSRDELVSAMSAIQAALEKRPLEGLVLQLRAPRAGDFGWVVERHGVLYAQEYGWDASFEGLVAGIVAKFACDPKPARQRAWIAEREGERLGCVFLVEKSKTVGQLRLLLVEPTARGRGVGRALVRECIRTANTIGYRKLMLWTNDVLHSARRIYQREGFRLVKQEKHRSWGHDLVGQYWELSLRAPAK
jgi:N-acetylglutamate synthase-like GNAT family acetyltransferase